MKRNVRAAAFAAAVLMTAMLLAGCAAHTADMAIEAPAAAPNLYDKEYAADAAAPAEMTESAESSSLGGGITESKAAATDLSQRKIIRTANVTLQTKEFDTAIKTLNTFVSDYNGYIQSSTVSGRSGNSYETRYAYYTVRIPAEKLDEFLSKTPDIGNVLETSTDEQEITEQYFDTESRLNMLRSQEERLNAILDKTTDMADIVQLVDAISEVIYEIENLTGTLRRYDGLISYSTVNLEVYEVYETSVVNPTPKTLGERISQEWDSSMKRLSRGAENFVVWIVGNAVELIIYIAIIIAIIAIIRAIRKRTAKRRKDKSPYIPEAPKYTASESDASRRNDASAENEKK